MTLFREINSLLFGLFLLVMSALVYFQFTQTKDFMAQQMESDLNNTMTSLGLMLKPHIETGDMVTAETLVNVIFESGFYQKVSLTTLADNKVHEWNNSINIDTVPQWFMALDIFEAQKQESLITSGWLQLAKLEIEAHPAIGYQALWRVMNDTLMIMSLFFILIVFFIRFRLTTILKPLAQIAEHAKAVSQRNFGEDIATPKTSELKSVVVAINTMSSQLKQMFTTLDQEVNDLKEAKLIDHVSGLPNRQYLSGQVASWLDEPALGGLMLAKFDWLDDIYRKYGYQGRDEMIKVIAVRMKAELPDVAECIVARMANTEFAFLLTKAEPAQIELYLQTLIRLINQEITKAGGVANHQFSIGVCQRIDSMKAQDLLAQADNALQQAVLERKTSHWIDQNQPQKFSREQWRQELNVAIANTRFSFYQQSIHHADSEQVIHQEIYSRLIIEDEEINASEFMPFVELLSLGSELDKCLLTALKQERFLVNKPLAINLTKDSLTDETFLPWLTDYLGKLDVPQQVSIEVPESAVNNHLQACVNLARIINEAGAKLGIDQCGRHIGSLDYLQMIKPDYIKLDRSFTYDLEHDEHHQGAELLRAIVKVAGGLNIDVIMTCIETSAQLIPISQYKVTGYQGFISPVEKVSR